MHRLSAAVLLLALLRPHAHAAPKNHDNDRGLWSFYTRPDIRAPKWDIEVYDEAALAPGYWFFGPYETLDMKDEHGNGWIGPHIYAQDGTLIWSAAPMFANGNVEDFRLSNVEGEELMTVMDQRHARGVFMDNHYEVRDRRKVNGPGPGGFNSHEFNFVENGTKALVVHSKPHVFSREESKGVGYSGRCGVSCDCIGEYDVATWEVTFDWAGCSEIMPEESTHTYGSINNKCGGRWDYIHANSVDKTPEGDYLFSCRHSDAIYKISHKTKKIVWRLGGTKSDFKHIDDFKFSRQHNIRYRGGNETHTIVSFLDNAKGIDAAPPTHPFSRGLLVALDEKSDPMTAQIIAHYDHPDGDGGLAFRRGNYQPLPNGNVFMCWSERALQSEHAEDGRILMRASLQPKWLGTYRSYKFEFTGIPNTKPDIKGFRLKKDGKKSTEVYVSWNGATEVHQWKLYKVTKVSMDEKELDSQKKDGFETKLTCNGHMKFVVVKGFAKNGTLLGESKTFKFNGKGQSEPGDEHPSSSIRDLLLFIMGLGIAGVVAGVIYTIYSLAKRRGSRGGVGMKFSLKDLWARGKYAPLSDKDQELQYRDGDSSESTLMGERRESEDDGVAEQEPYTIENEDER